MATSDVIVQLRLLDQLSGQIQRPLAEMNRLKSVIGDTKRHASLAADGLNKLGHAYENFASKAENAAARMSAARNKAIAGAAALFALSGPLRGVSDAQAQMVQIAQINEWSNAVANAHKKTAAGYELTAAGAAELSQYTKELRKNIFEISNITAQPSESLLNAMQVLTGQLGSRLSTDQYLELLRTAARTATQARMPVDQLASSAVALNQQLGILPEKMQDLFDSMQKGGQMGGFELKAMSQHFPTLAALWRSQMEPAYAEIGKGLEGRARDLAISEFGHKQAATLIGWLEIARLGAGDEQSAAENLKYYIQKAGLQQTSIHAQQFIDPTRLDLSRWGLNASDFTMKLAMTDAIQRKRAGIGVNYTDEELEAGKDAQGKKPKILGFDFDRYMDYTTKVLKWDMVYAETVFAQATANLAQSDRILSKVWNDHMARQAQAPIMTQLREFERQEQLLRSLLQRGGHSEDELKNLSQQYRWLDAILKQDESIKKALTGPALSKADADKMVPFEFFLTKWFKDIKGAEGTVGKNLADFKKTLEYQFNLFRIISSNIIKDFFHNFAHDPARDIFGWLGTKAKGAYGWMERNEDLVAPLARIGMFATAGLAGLAIARLAWASLGYAMAHAGMGAISLLRVIPGMGFAIGALTGPLGLLMKLGVLGGAGFLAWQHWDLLQAHAGPAIEMLKGFFGRLTTAFPALKGFEGFGDTLKSFVPSLESLKAVGSDLWESLKWLFTGTGDADAFGRLKEGLLGLVQATPGLGKISAWTQDFRDQLGGGQGLVAMMGAWTKLLSGGFLGFTGWMVARHGIHGLLLALMALRTVFFALGAAGAMLAPVMSLLGSIFMPMIQSFINANSTMFAMLGRALYLSGGIFAILAYNFGIRGAVNILKGMAYGLRSGAGGAWGNLTSEWRRLMTLLFGADLVGDDLNRKIAEVTASLFRLGRWLGSNIITPAFNAMAWAIRNFVDALEYWKSKHPASFDFVTDWGLKAVGAVAGIMMLAGAFSVLKLALRSFMAMIGVTGAMRVLFGASGLAGKLATLGLASPTALSRIMALYRTGGLAALMAGGGSFLLTNPIGQILLLAGAFYLAWKYASDLKELMLWMAGGNKANAATALPGRGGLGPEFDADMAAGMIPKAADQAAGQIIKGGTVLAAAIEAVADQLYRIRNMLGGSTPLGDTINGSLGDGANNYYP